MPDLPTLTVSQEHFDRLVAAFPGEDAEEKTESYLNWLINRLIERVRLVEAQHIDEQAALNKAAALAALDASLPPTMPEPLLP